MTLLRLSPTTSIQYDSLKALFSRLSAALANGLTTTDQLARTEAALAQISQDAKAMRLMVRQEIASAQQREREDRKPLSKAQAALQREYLREGYALDQDAR